MCQVANTLNIVSNSRSMFPQALNTLTAQQLMGFLNFYVILMSHNYPNNNMHCDGNHGRHVKPSSTRRKKMVSLIQRNQQSSLGGNKESRKIVIVCGFIYYIYYCFLTQHSRNLRRVCFIALSLDVRTWQDDQVAPPRLVFKKTDKA